MCSVLRLPVHVGAGSAPLTSTCGSSQEHAQIGGSTQDSGKSSSYPYIGKWEP